MSKKQKLNSYLHYVDKALEIVLKEKNHPPLKKEQCNQLFWMLASKNSFSQLPTGFGKTFAGVILPRMITVLKENFGCPVATEARVILISPLVNIIYSLESYLKHLSISYQILKTDESIDCSVEVVLVSPEQLYHTKTLNEVKKHSWSAIIIDEEHLVYQHGMDLCSQGKKAKKVFRTAFRCLSMLNDLGAPFEIHTATALKVKQLINFLGKQNSDWEFQYVAPERENLTYYIFSGEEAPSDFRNLQFVLDHLSSEDKGLMLVYVNSVQDGSEFYFWVNSYCQEEGLIHYSCKNSRPINPFAFLHANISEERKREILMDANGGKLRLLIATSAAGAGINIPVKTFVGWGFAKDPCSIIQAQGRAGRGMDSADIVWFFKPEHHGRRVSKDSEVRELLIKKRCIRETCNKWFSPSYQSAIDRDPHGCCSYCMTNNCEMENCEKCSDGFKKFQVSKEDLGPTLKNHITASTIEFLDALDVHEISMGLSKCSPAKFVAVLVKNCHKFKSVSDINYFLETFSLTHSVKEHLKKFIKEEFSSFIGTDEFVFDRTVESVDQHILSDKESSSDSEGSEDNSATSEYYDSSDSSD